MKTPKKVGNKIIKKVSDKIMKRALRQMDGRRSPRTSAAARVETNYGGVHTVGLSQVEICGHDQERLDVRGGTAVRRQGPCKGRLTDLSCIERVRISGMERTGSTNSMCGSRN